MRKVSVRHESYNFILSGPERKFDDSENKIAPEVGKSCVFPFKTGAGHFTPLHFCIVRPSSENLVKK